MTGGRSKRLRVLVDANILISILLSPNPARSAAAALLAEAAAGSYALIVPIEAIAETRRVTAEKPWLARRIPEDAVDRLVVALTGCAELAPQLETPAPAVGRDPGDDYLFAQAVLARVDVLVTRDKDLLDLAHVAGPRIVDPVAFLALLRASSDTACR